MTLEEAVEVSCPHCGAMTLLLVDRSAGERQDLLEDCQVCCRPIVFHVAWRKKRPRVEARTPDE
jgi:hypothetical protein